MKMDTSVAYIKPKGLDELARLEQIMGIIFP